jgi:hypothetical protein
MSRNALVLAALLGAIVLALLGHGHLADDVLDAVPPVEDPAPPVEAAPPVESVPPVEAVPPEPEPVPAEALAEPA